MKTGSGILQLSGTNSFTGGTQIQAGTLVLGSNQAIPAASSLTLSAGTLNLGGYANTAGTLVMQNGLITGNGSFSAASFNLQSGTLSGSLVGPGSLSKTTSGVVTITSSNSYSGGTTLSGGTLVVSADNNLGSTAGELTLNGGTLQVMGTSFSSTTRPVTSTSNGGGISVADPNNTLTLATQNLNGSGAFTKAGQGRLQLGGSIGSTAITVQDGILQLDGSRHQLTADPSLILWNVADLRVVDHNESVSSINLTGGTINTGTGTLKLTGSLNYAQSIWPATIEGNLALINTATVFSTNAGASSGLSIAAGISGSGGILASGGGTLTLSGSNTYVGPTSVNGVTLMLANPGAPGQHLDDERRLGPIALCQLGVGRCLHAWRIGICRFGSGLQYCAPEQCGLARCHRLDRRWRQCHYHLCRHTERRRFTDQDRQRLLDSQRRQHLHWSDLDQRRCPAGQLGGRSAQQ